MWVCDEDVLGINRNESFKTFLYFETSSQPLDPNLWTESQNTFPVRMKEQIKHNVDDVLASATSVSDFCLENERFSRKQIQIKLRWALFVTYTMRSEMCSLHLTHPSVHTWSSGQPTVQRPGSSRGLPVGAGIRTHNLGLPRVSSPTLYPLGQRLPVLHNPDRRPT